MSKKDCANANWYILGADDALSGQSVYIINERVARCAKFSIEANPEAWRYAYDTWAVRACTAEYAYGLGKYGRKLETFCEGVDLEGLTAANDIGYEYHALRRDYEAAVKDYNNDVSAIRSAQTSIRVSSRKLGKSGISPSDAQKHQNNIAKARQRISRLQSTLSSKKSYADQKERAFQAYEPKALTFERQLSAEQEFNGDQSMTFDPPVSVSGVIRNGKSRSLLVNVDTVEEPVYFEDAKVTLADFKAPFRTTDGDIKCVLQGKVKRKLNKEWRKLKKARADVRVKDLTLYSPTYGSNYELLLTGDISTETTGDLAGYFIDAGLGVRANERSRSDWYKNKACFADKPLEPTASELE